jgi:type III pantothenate kinase
MSVLLVDAGNTRIKWAIWNPETAVGQWIAAGDGSTADPQSLARALAGHAGITSALYCSVAGDATNAVIESTVGAAGIGSLRRFRSTARIGPVINDYERPEQLGADRLAAALGAWHRVGRDAVVVGAGTATTIDIVRAAGGSEARFLGGVILPGVDLMIASLARNTAGLPMASGSLRTIPGNTDDAIVSGCLQAQLGAIDRMRAALDPQAPCVLAGGAAPRLLPHLERSILHVPALVLEGLAVAILHGF